MDTQQRNTVSCQQFYFLIFHLFIKYSIMGNCFSATDQITPIDPISKQQLKEEAKKDSLLQECQKKVKYIKQHYDYFIAPDQQKKLQLFDKILGTLGEFSKKMKLTVEEQDICFGSIHTQLKNMKSSIENTWKSSLTDYQAYIWKCKRDNLHKHEMNEIVAIPKQSKSPPCLEDLRNVNFPILSYSNNSLIYIAGVVLKSTAFAAEQMMEPGRIDSFIERVCLNYNVTSYHNFSHGFSVFLMSYQVCSLSDEVKTYLNSTEIFFLLIAALAHDLNHKGRNNAYHVKKRTDLAILYSSQSVLENMHISTLFNMMDENPEGDLISPIQDSGVKARTKKILMKSILATDMTTHFSSLKVLKEKCEATEDSIIRTNEKNKYMAFQKDREEDRDIIIESIIHASDIGNPCLEYNNYINWAALLTIEFDAQHKEQKLQGLQLTPMLQYVDKPTFYKGQIGFCKHFVLPLWKQLTVFSPQLKVFSDQLESNILTLQQK